MGILVLSPARNVQERQGWREVEYGFELGWNTLRLAFRVGLIRDGEAWLAMVQDRNLTSHTYNRSTARTSEPAAGNPLPALFPGAAPGAEQIGRAHV